MKSVGEVMAIGRNIQESMQKALRGLETGLDGLQRVDPLVGGPKDEIVAALSADARPAAGRGPRPSRRAVRRGDPCGIRQVRSVVPRTHQGNVDAEGEVLENGLPQRCGRVCAA
jgi:carbamoyl-phosphate synthase large subunit